MVWSMDVPSRVWSHMACSIRSESILDTKAPLCGITSTSFSRASLVNVSCTGVRLTFKEEARSASFIFCPGGRNSSNIQFFITRYAYWRASSVGRLAIIRLLASKGSSDMAITFLVFCKISGQNAAVNQIIA